MSPVEQLTADRPLVPTLALARPRARALVVVACSCSPGCRSWRRRPRPTTRGPGSSGAARSCTSTSSTVGGPSWKPLPVLLHGALLAGRARSRPTCGSRRARGRAGRRASSSSASARASAAGSRAASAAAAACAARPGSSATPRWATPRACSSRFALGAVDRHMPAGGAQAFALGVGAGAAAARGVAVPRPLRAVAALARAAPAPPRRRRLRAAARLWLLPELWGSGDFCARDAPRADPDAPTAPPSPTGPGARRARPVRSLLTPAAWVGVAALVAALALGRRPRPRRPSGAELRAVGGLALGAVAWVGLVAYMTPTAASPATRATSSCPRRSCSCSAGAGVGLGAAGRCAPRAAAGPARPWPSPSSRPASSPCRAARGWRRRSAASPTRRA